MERFEQMYWICIHDVDIVVVNVSSPNTPGLRDMQAREQLKQLINKVNNTDVNNTYVNNTHVNNTHVTNNSVKLKLNIVWIDSSKLHIVMSHYVEEVDINAVPKT